jgi:hypothetical protein
LTVFLLAGISLILFTICCLLGKSSNNVSDMTKKAAFKNSPPESGFPCCAMQHDRWKLAAVILFLGLKEDTKKLVCFVYCLTFCEMNSLLSSFEMEQTFL